MLSCVAASQSDQAVWSDRRAGKRSEESLIAFFYKPAVHAWNDEGGFPPALARRCKCLFACLPCRRRGFGAGLPEGQVRHG